MLHVVPGFPSSTFPEFAVCVYNFASVGCSTGVISLSLSNSNLLRFWLISSNLILLYVISAISTCIALHFFLRYTINYIYKMFVEQYGKINNMPHRHVATAWFSPSRVGIEQVSSSLPI